MSHKIAIVTSRDFYQGEYGEDYVRVVDSITDWEEVTDDEFKTLTWAAPRLGFTIIERPVDTKKFIAKTIAEYKALADAEEKKAAEEKEKREAAVLERKFKKDLKDKASKEKMLAKLSEELGVEIVKKV